MSRRGIFVLVTCVLATLVAIVLADNQQQREPGISVTDTGAEIADSDVDDYEELQALLDDCSFCTVKPSGNAFNNTAVEDSGAKWQRWRTMAKSQKLIEKVEKWRTDKAKSIKRLSKEIEEHNQRIRDLQGKIMLKREKIERESKFQKDYDANIGVQSDRLHAQRTALRDQNYSVMSLQDKEKEMKSSVEMQKKKIDNKKILLDKLQQQIATAEQQMTAIKTFIDEKAQIAVEKQKSLATKASEVDAKSKEILDERARIQTINLDIDAKAGEIQARNAEIADRRSKLERTDADIIAKGQAVNDIDKEIAALNTHALDLSAQAANVNAEILQKNASVQDLRTKLAKQKSDLDEQQTLLQAKQDELTKTQSSVNELKAKIEQQMRIAQVRLSDIDVKSREILNKSSFASQQKTQLSTNDFQIAEYRRQLAAQKAAVTQAQSDLVLLTNELASQLEQINRTSADVANVNIFLARQLAVKDKVLADIGKTQDKFDKDISVLNAQFSALTSELDASTFTKKRREADLALLKQQLDEAQRLSNKVDSDVATAANAKTELTTKIGELKSQIAALNVQHVDMSARIERARNDLSATQAQVVSLSSLVNSLLASQSSMNGNITAVDATNAESQAKLAIANGALASKQKILDDMRITEESEKRNAKILMNGWKSSGIPSQTFWWKTIGSLCYLGGRVRASASSVVGYLPRECRPQSGNQIFHQNAGSSFVRINIFTDGKIQSEIGSHDGWLSLSGIAFPIGNAGKAISLAQGWAVYGNAWADVTYLVQSGLCTVNGIVRNAAGTWTEQSLVFTLPAECRPTAVYSFAVNHHDAFVRVDVRPDGAVRYVSGASSGYNWMSLSGIVFPVQSSAVTPLTPAQGWQLPNWLADGAKLQPLSYFKSSSVCYISGYLKYFGVLRSSLFQIPPECRPDGDITGNVLVAGKYIAPLTVRRNGYAYLGSFGAAASSATSDMDFVSIGGFTINTDQVSTSNLNLWEDALQGPAVTLYDIASENYAVTLTADGVVSLYNSDLDMWSNISSDFRDGTVAIGADGELWGCNAKTEIYRYNPDTALFVRVVGAAKRVAVGGPGFVQVISASNDLYEWNADASSWTALKSNVASFDIGSDGESWYIDTSDNVFRRAPGATAYTAITFPATTIFGSPRRVLVGEIEQVYVITSTKQVVKYMIDDGSWFAVILPNNTQITVDTLTFASDGLLFGAINKDGYAMRAKYGCEDVAAYGLLPGATTFSSIAAASYDRIVGFKSNDEIWLFNGASTAGWRRLSGTAARGSIAYDGTLYVVNRQSNLFRYIAPNAWEFVVGSVAQVCVGSSNNVVLISTTTEIKRWDAVTKTWTVLPGGGTKCAIGEDGELWVIGTDAQPYRWQSSSNSWIAVAMPNSLSAVRISVKNARTVYATTSDDQLMHFSGGSWIRRRYPTTSENMSLALKDTLEVGRGAFMLSLRSDGMPVAMFRSLQRLEAWSTDLIVDTKFQWVDIGSRDYRVAIGSSNQIYFYNFDQWTRLPGTASFAGVGSDGGIWTTDSSGVIRRYENANDAFTTIPGYAVKVCVGSYYQAAVINSNAKDNLYLWNHDTSSWKYLPGIASSFCGIGSDGELWSSTIDNNIYRFNYPKNRWDQMLHPTPSNIRSTRVTVVNRDTVYAIVDTEVYIWTNGEWQRRLIGGIQTNYSAYLQAGEGGSWITLEQRGSTGFVRVAAAA